MKRLLLPALMLALGLMASAAPVSTQRAQQIALTYMKAQPEISKLSVKSVESLTSQTYLINFTPEGWAIVSADDVATPMLAFSLTGSLSSRTMPENMSFMIDEATTNISRASLSATKAHPRWNTIENGSFQAKSRAQGENIDPLIKVNWDQGDPYNQFCPGEGSKKAVVGCVAVAMSQAMSVQRWPVSPQGSNAYGAAGYGNVSVDYDKEDPYDWETILSNPRSKEVARLLYHAGVSVNMGYGADGSGIPSNQVYRITNALNSIFGYTGTQYFWRAYYTGDWEQLLLNELQAGRAIVYNAIDTKGGYGHSFNICGYRDGMFYVNWGWGGYGNNYFSIDYLADARMGMNYDASHVAVVGIGAPNTPLRNVGLSDLTVEAGLPDNSVVSVLLVNGQVPTSEFKVEMTGAYFAGTYVDIPFRYDNGLIRTTGPIQEGTKPIYVRFKITHKESGTSITQGFNIEVEGSKTIAQKTKLTYDRASGDITLHTKFDSSYTVRNAQGNVVVDGHLTTLPEIKLNRTMLTPGVNTVEINCAGKTESVRIKL